MANNTNDQEYDFFNVLNNLWRGFVVALDNYQKEQYDDVKTAEPEEEPKKTVDETADTCCDKKCDGDCRKTIEEDEHKLIIVDKSITCYDDALKIMVPKLNDLTFAMRINTFSAANVIFIFDKVKYAFNWNKENDRFEGFEYHEITQTSIDVYYDEINESVVAPSEQKQRIDCSANTESKPATDEDTDVTADPENCPYKNSLFYPYGKRCENCPNKTICFTPLDEVETASDSKEAVYDKDGNAIADEDIPSLKDYTDKKELCKELESSDNSVITGKSLYDKLNNEFSKREEKYLDAILKGVETLINSEIFTVYTSPDDIDINVIKFTLGQIKGCTKVMLPDDIEDVVHLQNLANAIKEHFNFKEVFYTDDEIYCTLT